MVLTTESFDERGGGKSKDEAPEKEVAVEEPVEKVADEPEDNTADVVKALEKVERAQVAAAKALGKLGEKDLVTGVNRQRQDIVAAIADVKKRA